MRTLQILMPMGGLGQRFSAQGYALPKPLIPVDGMPMLQKALTSFSSLEVPKRVFAVYRREHEDEFGLGKVLKTHVPEVEIVLIDRLTGGAAETCLCAKDLLSPEDGLVVLDCDLWFDSPEYLRCIERCLQTAEPPWAGALTTFEATHPRYSFVRVDASGEVTDIAEKQPISTHAVIGAYFFSRCADFLRTAEDLVATQVGKEAPEYYVSLTYRRLLREQLRFVAFPSRGYHSFGTPEELEAYERRAR